MALCRFCPVLYEVVSIPPTNNGALYEAITNANGWKGVELVRRAWDICAAFVSVQHGDVLRESESAGASAHQVLAMARGMFDGQKRLTVLGGYPPFCFDVKSP